MHYSWRLFALVAFLIPLLYVRAQAEEEEATSKGSPVGSTLLRLPSKTLGGDQYWADEFIHGDWRIQRQALTGNYRLLDPSDHRRAYGDYDACRSEFDKLRKTEEIPALKKEAVVLLHGLLRSRDTMQPLAKLLQEQTPWEIINFTYPSSCGTVSEHAAVLDKMLSRLEGVEKIHFVGHSLGNLVVRHWMSDQLQQQKRIDPRVQRFVMLGPPNNGAQMAERFESNLLFGMVMGQSGKQLAKNWSHLDGKLCVPPCEFGILAGNAGLNPLIDGDDDLCVAVEETKLPGAADFRVLPLNHSTLRTDANAQRFTLEFLRNGFFESNDKRQSLRSEP